MSLQTRRVCFPSSFPVDFTYGIVSRIGLEDPGKRDYPAEGVTQPLASEWVQCMRNKRDWRAGQEKRMRKLPTELSAQWHQIGGWLHNTPMFIDPSSIYVPLSHARTTGVHVCTRISVYVCVYAESTTERYAQFKTANTGPFDAH